jgi:hypothetical protein
MARVRGLLTLCLLLGISTVLAGCGGDSAKIASAESVAAKAKPTCPDAAAWRKLATRVKVPVYCPGWLPDPLTGRLGAEDNNIHSVAADRSYLESWVWQETGGGAAGGELHVNLRAYPGVTKIPTCRTGGSDSRNVPCFASPVGSISANGITSPVYTVNQDADSWHYALLWRRAGTLYMLSEHVAPPLTGQRVKQYLKRELASLVLIEPTAS